MAKSFYPYRKGVDITAWVLQLLVCVILLGLSASILVLDDQISYYGYVLYMAAGISIGLTGITIVINIVEIVLIARQKMPPALYLSFACVKTLIWLIVFIFGLITLNIVGIILAAVVVITAAVQLGFGASIVHKKRKGTLMTGAYARTINPTQHQHVGTGYGVPAHTSVYDSHAPQQGYGVPSPQHGYGVPSTQQGYGVPSPQQGYGVPSPQQAYGVPSPQGYVELYNNNNNTNDNTNTKNTTTSSTPVNGGYYSPVSAQQSSPPPQQQQQQGSYGYPPNTYELANR